MGRRWTGPGRALLAPRELGAPAGKAAGARRYQAGTGTPSARDGDGSAASGWAGR